MKNTIFKRFISYSISITMILTLFMSVSIFGLKGNTKASDGIPTIIDNLVDGVYSKNSNITLLSRAKADTENDTLLYQWHISAKYTTPLGSQEDREDVLDDENTAITSDAGKKPILKTQVPNEQGYYYYWCDVKSSVNSSKQVRSKIVQINVADKVLYDELKYGDFENFSAYVNGGSTQLGVNDIKNLVWNTTAAWDKTSTNTSKDIETGTRAIYGIAYTVGTVGRVAELCSSQISSLYQEIATVPGKMYEWSLLHTPRNSGQTDLIAVVIGKAKNTSSDYKSGQNFWNYNGSSNLAYSPHTFPYGVNENTLFSAVVKKYASDNGITINTMADYNKFLKPEYTNLIEAPKHVNYEGEEYYVYLCKSYRGNDNGMTPHKSTYMVPDGQGITFFSFVSLVSVRTTSGNILDDITFKTLDAINVDEVVKDESGTKLTVPTSELKDGYSYGIVEYKENEDANYDLEGDSAKFIDWHAGDGDIVFDGLTPGKTYKIVAIPTAQKSTEESSINSSPGFVLDENAISVAITTPIPTMNNNNITAIESMSVSKVVGSSVTDLQLPSKANVTTDFLYGEQNISLDCYWNTSEYTMWPTGNDWKVQQTITGKIKLPNGLNKGILEEAEPPEGESGNWAKVTVTVNILDRSANIKYKYADDTLSGLSPVTHSYGSQTTLQNTLLDGTRVKWYDNPQKTGNPITEIAAFSQDFSERTYYAEKWYSVDVNAALVSKEDITLPSNLTVAGGAEKVGSAIYVKEGTTISAPSILSSSLPDGYTFEYWYKGSSSDIDIFNGVATITINENTVLNAKFDPDLYAMTFNWNYDQYSKSGKNKLQPANKTLIFTPKDASENDDENLDIYFTNEKEGNIISNFVTSRAGYNFEGWNQEKTAYKQGKTDGYYNASSFLASLNNNVIASNYTWYGQWSKITYNIKYDLDGGKFDSKTNGNFIRPATFTIESDDILVSMKPVKEYNIFKGYTITSNKGNGGNFGGQGLAEYAKIPEGTYGDITIKANWEKIKHKVTFVDENGKAIESKPQLVYHGESAIAPKTPNKIGYEFVSWDTDFSNVVADIIVKPIYKEISIIDKIVEKPDVDKPVDKDGKPIVSEPKAKKVEEIKKIEETNKETIETSDNFNLLPVVAMATISAMVLLLVIRRSKKEK